MPSLSNPRLPPPGRPPTRPAGRTTLRLALGFGLGLLGGWLYGLLRNPTGTAVGAASSGAFGEVGEPADGLTDPAPADPLGQGSDRVDLTGPLSVARTTP